MLCGMLCLVLAAGRTAKSAWIRALTGPLTLIPLFAGGTLAVLRKAYWVFPLVLLVSGLAAWFRYRKLTKQRGTVPEIPSLDPPQAVLAAALAKLKQEIEQAFSAGDPAADAYGALLRPQLDQLLEKSFLLLQKQALLERFLKDNGLGRLESETAALEEMSRRQSDAGLRQAFGEALASKREALESFRKLRKNADLLEAELIQIEATLRNILGKALILQTSGGDLLSEGSPPVREELGSLLAKVSALEELAVPALPGRLEEEPGPRPK